MMVRQQDFVKITYDQAQGLNSLLDKISTLAMNALTDDQSREELVGRLEAVRSDLRDATHAVSAHLETRGSALEQIAERSDLAGEMKSVGVATDVRLSTGTWKKLTELPAAINQQILSHQFQITTGEPNHYTRLLEVRPYPVDMSKLSADKATDMMNLFAHSHSLEALINKVNPPSIAPSRR